MNWFDIKWKIDKAISSIKWLIWKADLEKIGATGTVFFGTLGFLLYFSFMEDIVVQNVGLLSLGVCCVFAAMLFYSVIRR